MKRILSILILLGIAAGAIASPYLMVLARKNAGGGCTTLEHEVTSTGSPRNFGLNSGLTYIASLVDADDLSGSFSCCNVGVELAPVGTPTQTITLYLYSNDDNSTPADPTDDNPDTLLGTSTSTISGAAVASGGQGVYYASFSGVSAGASDFWVVQQVSAVDGANYLQWIASSVGSIEEMRKSEDGVTWSIDSNAREGAVEIYSP